MKRTIWIVIVAAVAVALVSIGASQAQTPVGTAFTYQGRLFDDEGNPVNALCYFLYRLFEDEVGGSELDSGDQWPPQSITDGYFTLYPEFDCASCWNGDVRWLEIQFRCPYPTGPLTTLPRQHIYAAPYAIHSLNATATPQPTPTLVSTATPQPTATPMETATPQPTPTLVSTATPQPTATPLVNVAFTNAANIFTETQAIANMAPSLVMTDTTESAKSLTIAVDADAADMRENAGAPASLVRLDLANNFVGIGITPTAQLHLYGSLYPISGTMTRLDFGSTWNRVLVSGINSGNNTFIQSWNRAETVATKLALNPSGGSVLVTSDLQMGNKTSVYNNVATEGYGVPAIVDDVAILTRGSDVGSTNFTNAGTAGTYRISYYIQAITTNAGSGAVTLTIAWTDETTARSQSSGSVSLASSNYASGIVFVHLGSGSVSYSTAHTGSYLTATYNLYITVERLS